MTAPTFDALIREAARRLEAGGIEDSRKNALTLMLGAFGNGRAALISAGASPVPEMVEEAFRIAVARRLAREPLQHITGTAPFYGLEFICDARALIPRFDSEIVVEQVLDLIAPDAPARVADLGTGSGCLLAAILHNRPAARGVGVEASAAAASLARENFAALGLNGRAAVFDGRWADWGGWGEADLIVSNPPYIVSDVIPMLDPEVRDHDPMAALDGGADGLDAYREIIEIGARRMKTGAPLVLEIGHDQRAAVTGLLQASGFTGIAHRLDLGGNDRCVMGRAPGPRR